MFLLRIVLSSLSCSWTFLAFWQALGLYRIFFTFQNFSLSGLLDLFKPILTVLWPEWSPFFSRYPVPPVSFPLYFIFTVSFIFRKFCCFFFMAMSTCLSSFSLFSKFYYEAGWNGEFHTYNSPTFNNYKIIPLHIVRRLAEKLIGWSKYSHRM